MNAGTPNLGEFELIRRFFMRDEAARGARPGVVLGLGGIFRKAPMRTRSAIVHLPSI
jgi:hypothetical protein